MQAIQCKESTSETVIVKSEQNRILKRNIGDLAIDGKINGEKNFVQNVASLGKVIKLLDSVFKYIVLYLFAEDLRSPARKEVKISHETHLRRELEQWKDLMNERGIHQSVAHG